ncbi:major facilitator superfamily transporter [Aspergillus neoniger CBS 115656]|uniref:Major facilitator superfamily transporter n=1 Tax=Aspergillus neoniger (strain CBS 115656) TaxID=1448310 RepID=A0A318YXC0_ASPNB|nr:major facilitator superfamily transporter [Aspergillus neoniger CBS 115656]PYH37483.1 major facilitator superfamily transporter [Aspergillus neoniger CBS 115656]
MMEFEIKTTDQDAAKDVNIDVVTVQLHFTAEEEKRVVRKIDYLDKQSLSYASVFGLIDDLSLEGSEYSWCSSLFYLGQLVAEYPFIYLMSRLPLTKFVGATIVFWGAVCMCLAAPTNFAGFGAVRFLLGVTEGAVSPAFVTLTSMWYRKQEHASRVGIWVTMNGLAQVLGSLLMYGIGKQHYPRLEPWRVLFLVCGALTAAFGVVFYFLVPTGPQKAWFLSDREREVLLARMAQDREGGDKTNFSKSQVKETLLDVRAWFIFAFGILVTMQSPVLTFASLIIKNLNYDKYQTMLYTSPSGAVQIVAIWIGVLGCQLLPNNRSLVVILLSIPPLIGNILLLKLPLTTGWGLIVSSWLLLRPRKKDADPDPNPPPRRTSPEAPGILDTNCTIITQNQKQRRYKLPIPDPEHRQRQLQTLATSSARPQNPQSQSAFFSRLPLEVRNIIYRELFGGGRVHVDYLWKRPSAVVARPPTGKDKGKKADALWQWWHRVCAVSDEWVDDRFEERCVDALDERDETLPWGWEKAAPPGTKLQGVAAMLTVCQMGYTESLPILYTTNTFVTGPSMDTPFIIRRLLAPPYTALITGMDIAITMAMPYTAPPDLPGNWTTVYPAFFDLLQHSFSGLRRLHLTIYLNPWEKSKEPVTGASREWTELCFFVPGDWFELLRGRFETQLERQTERRWALKRTSVRPLVVGSCF